MTTSICVRCGKKVSGVHSCVPRSPDHLIDECDYRTEEELKGKHPNRFIEEPCKELPEGTLGIPMTCQEIQEKNKQKHRDKLIEKAHRGELYKPPTDLKVTIDVGNILKYFLIGWRPPAEDEKDVYIGISTLAYVSDHDPAHVFIVAAARHDAAYSTDSWEVLYHVPRWIVDMNFLMEMLIIAKTDITLIKEAQGLYLMVREYGADRYPGVEE